MAPTWALACISSLAFCCGQNCGQNDDMTTLLQLPLKRNSATSVRSLALIESARNVVKLVNEKQNPVVCREATDATRQVLEEALPRIMEQRDSWSDQLRTNFEAVESCATAVLGGQTDQVQRSRESHRACRLEEQELESSMEACRLYEEFQTTVRNRPCPAFPNDGELLPEALEQARDDLAVAFDEAGRLRANCRNERTALDEKRAECSVAQRTFEDNYCTLRSNCASAHACRTSAEETYHQTEERVRSELASLRSEFLVLKHVECLLNHADQALAQSEIVEEETLVDCAQPDTDELDVTFPVMSRAEECDATIFSRSPCEGGFLEAEYADLHRQTAVEANCAACSALQACCTGTFMVDFNSGTDDSGATSAGSLAFVSPNGLTVRFTSDGAHGATGVRITTSGRGVQDGIGPVLASAGTGSGNSAHRAGIIAHFSCGVRRVSFHDTDDSSNPRTLFALDDDGNIIGQTPHQYSDRWSIDGSSTGGALIHSVEFDAEFGTASDGNSFSLDNFEVECGSS